MTRSIYFLALLGLLNCTDLNSQINSSVSATMLRTSLHEVMQIAQENHFQPRVIDDIFSEDFLETYLNKIDPDRIYFLGPEVEYLETFKYQIDDQLKEGEITFFLLTDSMLQAGFNRAAKIIQELSNGIDTTIFKEYYTLPNAKSPFSSSEEALKQIWKKRLRYLQLQQMNLQANPENEIDWTTLNKKTFNSAIHLLKQALQEKQQQNQEDHFHDYINTFLHLHDIQSQFLSASDRAFWNANFTRSMVGIGAQIEVQNGYPIIKQLTENGPAQNSHRLHEGDILLSLKDEHEEVLDCFGLSLSQVINYLRGKEGSSVSLKVKKKNKQTISVSLIRASIPLEQVKAFTLTNADSNAKVACLKIPRFYGGETGVAQHIKSALDTLNSRQLDGLIIDIRNNQGGSSFETLKVLDFFLNEGPLMHFSNASDDIRTRSVKDQNVLFNGPLVVLVNERSSSGSELFAGTLQDYGRAIIAGGKATFGKGTRQRFIDLETGIHSQQEPLPGVKLTVGNFYTASGRTPQYKGITPDIQLPDDYTLLKSGERRFDLSIRSKDLPHINCQQNIIKIPDLKWIKARSDQRIKNNPAFMAAEKKAHLLYEQQNRSSSPLDYDSFVQNYKPSELDHLNSILYAPIPDFEVFGVHWSNTTPSVSQRNLDLFKGDPYLYESYSILTDWIASS